MGCSKMNDPIAGYIKNGEIIYSTSVDSLKAFSGNQRIKLTWLLPTNHSAVKAVAYWDNKTKSRELPLIKSADNTYQFILENMPEASYLLSVFTFDKNGNTSVKSEVSTVAYGERYRSGLLNRVYIKISKDQNGALLINWGPSDKSQITMEVEYTDISNNRVVQSTPSAQNSTSLAGVNFSKPIRYRTIYNPGLSAIDVFAADWSNPIDISRL